MNKHIHILLILLLFFVVCDLKSKKNEQEILDSLLMELPKAKEDTNKVKILNSLSHQYYYSNPDSAIYYATNSVQLSKELDWERGLAGAYNYLGVSNSIKGDYKHAQSYFQKALELYIEIDEKENISQQYGNLGIVAMNSSRFPEALEYYQKALKMDEEIKNKEGIARQLGNIGLVYMNLSDFRKALEYNKRALKIREESGEKDKISKQLGNIALNYTYLGNHKKALEFNMRALAIDEELNNTKGMAIRLGNIGILYRDLYDYEKPLEYYWEALEKNKEIGSKSGIAINLGNIGEFYYRLSQDSVRKRLQKNGTKLDLDKYRNLERAIEYTNRAREIAVEIDAKRQLIELYQILDKANKSLRNFKLAYENQSKWADLKDSIFSVEKTAEIANLEARKENELKEKALKVKDLELLRKESEQSKLFIGLGVIIFVLVLIILQRRKSEKLLLNILPAKIAKRLKRNEKNIADRFEEASIIFIDIVGFTQYSKGTEPEQVVSALNDIFTRFDYLAKKHGLEKIKTIGDCYMAVAGLPEENPEHALATARFALEAKDLMHNYNTPDGKKLKFRIGIDSGPVVAGIIGKSKFSYDLWGDAVNTASRMESTGLPDEIQVTKSFIRRIEGKGIGYKERGHVEIKGKGNITTFLLK